MQVSFKLQILKGIVVKNVKTQHSIALVLTIISAFLHINFRFQEQSSLETAREYYLNKNYNKARQVLENIAKPERNACFYHLLGRVYRDMGGKNEREQAEIFFNKALTLNPENIDCILDYARLSFQKKDYHEASIILNKAVRIDPSHAGVLESIIELFEKMPSERLMETARTALEGIGREKTVPENILSLIDKLKVDKNSEVKERIYLKILENDPDNGKVNLLLSTLLYEKEEHREAAKYYLNGIRNLDDETMVDEQYEFHQEILSVDEKKEYKALPEAEKGDYLYSFWQRKDPNPITPDNERLIEHFRRVKLAKTLYTNPIKPGYDLRGKYYIKYGEPDSRSSSIGSGASTEWTPTEQWAYPSIHPRLVLNFAERNGIFVHPFGAGVETDIRQMVYDIPHEYHQPSFKFRRLMDIAGSYAQFKAENGKTRTEVYFAFKPISQDFDIDKNLARYDFTFVAYDSLYNMISTTQEDYNYVYQYIFSDDIESQIGQCQFTLDPGKHRLGIQIENEKSNHGGILQIDEEFRDFRGDSLMVSDIQFSTNVTTASGGEEYEKNGLVVMPYPFTYVSKDGAIIIYYEVYNLRFGRNETTRFEVEYTIERKTGDRTLVEKGVDRIKRAFFTKGSERVSSSFIRTGESTMSPEFLRLDIRNMVTGPSILRIKVTDLVSGKTAGIEKEFVIVE